MYTKSTATGITSVLLVSFLLSIASAQTSLNPQESVNNSALAGGPLIPLAVTKDIAGLQAGSSTPQITIKQQNTTIAYSTHERFATFLSGNDFKATLLLENVRADVPLTFSPSLILSSGEVALDKVTVAAHSTANIDITGFLQSHGYSDQRGTVSIRYSFSTYGPGMAVVESVDDTHGLYLNSYAASSEEYWAGTGYDAVLWTPQEGTQGFIAITNTSADSHVVHISFLVNGRSESQPDIQVPPRHTQFMPINDLLARSTKSGAGIHLDVEQDAGDNYAGTIVVDGQVFDKRTSFSKHIHFMDKDLQFPTGTLRSHFLLLGNQPSDDGYPANVSFRSVAAVRNVDTIPVTVTPTIKFLRNGVAQSVSLPSFVLGVSETKLVDFSQQQKAGFLPPDFHQGTVEISPDSGRVSIVGELFNVGGSGGGYVVGPSFTSYPSHGTASIWRTDGTFQTTVMVENTATTDDRVTLTLFSNAKAYTKTFSVAGGGLLKINVKDLEQNAIPDDNGGVLSGISGVLQIIGGHNAKSKLSVEKIIHSTSEADYVGLPPNQCDYVTGIALQIDFSSGTQPFPVIMDYEWALSVDTYEPSFGSTSSDSSLAQVNSDPSTGADMVAFTPANDGQDHSVDMGYPYLIAATSCDACSGSTFALASFSVSVGGSLGSYEFSNVANNLCTYTLNCPAGTTCRCGKQYPAMFAPTGPACGTDWYIIPRLVVIINGTVGCFPFGPALQASGPEPCK